MKVEPVVVVRPGVSHQRGGLEDLERLSGVLQAHTAVARPAAEAPMITVSASKSTETG